MQIRKISIQDIENLKEIGKRTFIETYASVNSKENMTEYLENKFSIEVLKAELNDKNSEFYFSEFKEKIIGYLKVNTGESQTEFKNENALEIERIYVLKEFHGKKIGQILYEKAIELGKQKNVDYVWLAVWEQNPKAIRFYEKNGFLQFDKQIFKLGNEEQSDIMMKLELNK
ncbi:GNAT family N-acetyltransferase [Mariniflexile sp. AS56]|uniref:GNAT family N-acetyltransferase n=1 Tax=Mariniflexile sp. AS56 TaxID=3063957 RepID=UPI0026ED52D4|nr:GNAT family N-acetyltransferase [Mariniflexile sp. AS56]MDO7173224.1 GNAT family N-acetyltransferase [Mariniflexile sp. AS56]